MRLLIVWAGGHGRSLAEAALASGTFTLSGFLDDQATHVWEFPVLGGTQDFAAWRTVADAAIVAVGNTYCASNCSSNSCRRVLHWQQ